MSESRRRLPMLTIKVVTEWCGTQVPPFDGFTRPTEQVFEAKSVYEDAGVVYCYGVEGFGPPGPHEEESSTITYQPVVFGGPWRKTMYVMNRSGATISKFVLGWSGGDIGCEAKVAESPWHPVKSSEKSVEAKSHGEQTEVAGGVTAS
jgi:hypothetical protein